MFSFFSHDGVEISRLWKIEAKNLSPIGLRLKRLLREKFIWKNIKFEYLYEYFYLKYLHGIYCVYDIDNYATRREKGWGETLQ